MEFYSHQQLQQQQSQQQQQKQQQPLEHVGETLATSICSASATPPTITSTTNSTTTAATNNHNNNSSSNNNNNSNNIINTPPPTVSSTVSADAATVAIAKDMLQLHHGGVVNNNNNNTNNNNNNNNVDNIVQQVEDDRDHSHHDEEEEEDQEFIDEIPVEEEHGTVLYSVVRSSPDSASQQEAGAATNHNSNNNNSNNAAATTTTYTSTTATTPPPAQADNAGFTMLHHTGPVPENALGFLKFEQELLYITEPCTVIGRNSSSSHVHFHVAENNLVSRKHFHVLFDAGTRDFYVQCLSKNGIFVDDFLQRRNVEPLRLPECCYFRFPSTEIRIQFESFVSSTGSADGSGAGGAGSMSLTAGANNHGLSAAAVALHNSGGGSGGHPSGGAVEHILGGSGYGNAHVIISPAPPDVEQQHHHHHHAHHAHHHTHASSSPSATSSSTAAAHLVPIESSNAIYSPLKISIPKKEQKSPYLSPTGTISAANSCPASPRQGFHQNQANYNNNYGNNNLQNQQDLFQTPSTASYNHNEKPPYSYAQLIVQAISAAPDKQLTLSGIYSFIVKHYPYYRKETNKGWQNSIRHNLSLNRYFIKVARSQDEPGKGSFWRIDPDSGAKLIDHSYKKRRQRSSQGFRPPYGMPRSAPVSPSHMDNSRESSPLQEIVLQSAPGSPGMSLENRAAEAGNVQGNDIMYNSQNMHQANAAGTNNSHNQYNSSSSGSPYYITNAAGNQNAAASMHAMTAAGVGQHHQQHQHLQPAQSSHIESGGGGGGGGVGALIALKRNHAMAANAAAAGNSVVSMGQHQQLQHQHHLHQQPLHPDIIYEELPTDYSGNMESGDDECDAAKRPKYISEVL